MNLNEFRLVKEFLEWEGIKYYIEDNPEIIARKSSGKQNPKIPGIWIVQGFSLTWCEGFYWCVDFVRKNGINRT